MAVDSQTCLKFSYADMTKNYSYLSKDWGFGLTLYACFCLILPLCLPLFPSFLASLPFFFHPPDALISNDLHLPCNYPFQSQSPAHLLTCSVFLLNHAVTWPSSSSLTSLPFHLTAHYHQCSLSCVFTFERLLPEPTCLPTSTHL